MDISPILDSLYIYGSKGEKIYFECFELTIFGGAFTEDRVYNNTPFKVFDEYELLPESIREVVATTLSETSDFTFFDYSERENGCYSVGFMKKRNGECADEAKFSWGGMDYSKLLQTGLIVDPAGTVTQEKIYYTITPDDNEVINRLVPEDIYSLIATNQYTPFLYGINRQNGEVEEKIYFINSIKNDSRREIKQAVKFVREIGWPEEMMNILDVTYSHKLYMKGFAYSEVDGKPKWRLYFFK